MMITNIYSVCVCWGGEGRACRLNGCCIGMMFTTLSRDCCNVFRGASLNSQGSGTSFLRRNRRRRWRKEICLPTIGGDIGGKKTVPTHSKIKRNIQMYKTFAALAVQKTIKITSAVKKRTSRPQLACAPSLEINCVPYHGIIWKLE